MMRLLDILNLPLTTLIKEEYKNIKDSKHSPVYRKSGVEGFAPLFSFFSVNLGKAGSKMKLAIQIIGLVLGMILLPLQANAQIKGIVTYADWDEDNAILGDSTNIMVFAKFVSATTDQDTTVYGEPFFWYKTNWSLGWNPTWIDSLEVLDTITGPYWIPQGINQFHTRIYCTPDENVLRTGPVNVIIIWPAFFNPAFDYVDSADFVLSNEPVIIGIEEEPIQKFGSTAFPNPAGALQVVFINSKYSQDISSVSIMNSLGQMMSVKEFSEGEDSKGYVLPTEDLQSGIYHIHIIYKDKKREVVKFIKN